MTGGAVAAVKDAAGLFDAHLHIIDPRFPVLANQEYVPDPFTVTDYRARTSALGVVGGAVVAGSFQGDDQSFLRVALAELGPAFVGVANLAADASDAQIRDLHQAGVRAMRINLRRTGREALAGLERRTRRVWELAGWHTELYLDAADLPELEPRLARLPQISIDHLGLTTTGQDALLRLVERGARVKATGFGRTDLDVPATLRAIHAVNPHALMAGTDLPSTRARRPFADADLDLITDTLDAHAVRAVLLDNARALYHAPRSPT